MINDLDFGRLVQCPADPPQPWSPTVAPPFRITQEGLAFHDTADLLPALWLHAENVLQKEINRHVMEDPLKQLNDSWDLVEQF